MVIFSALVNNERTCNTSPIYLEDSDCIVIIEGQIFDLSLTAPDNHYKVGEQHERGLRLQEDKTLLQ